MFIISTILNNVIISNWILWKTITYRSSNSEMLATMSSPEDGLPFENHAPSTKLFAILILKPDTYITEITSSSHMHIFILSLSMTENKPHGYRDLQVESLRHQKALQGKR